MELISIGTFFLSSLAFIVVVLTSAVSQRHREYPGTGGRNGNQVSPSDTANFLVFLQELKVALPAGQNRTSATGSHIAFIGADGSPIADVKAFAATLDNLLVMNYDVWGASSTPGPNSPLSDACPDSMQPNANQASAVATWTAAGMPASKVS
jgi:chitinase